MLDIKNLCVFGKNNDSLLENISFTLSENVCLGLTGASGSGKTTIIKSIMGILDSTCRIVSGDIVLDGKSLLSYSKKDRRELCGTILGFMPQNPMTAFFHHCKIGKQMTETFRLRLGLSTTDAVYLAKSVLKKVNLQDTTRVMNAYPSQMSGGMLQRVAVAVLLGLKPRYILADEPTSALDEENKNHVLKLLQGLSHAGVLFISHDVTALSKLCSETMVMEKGEIIEKNITKKLFLFPCCEWTKRFAAASQIKEGGGWYWKELK